MCTSDTWVFGGKRCFPWALTPGLGWGRVEVPPDSLAPVVTSYTLGHVPSHHPRSTPQKEGDGGGYPPSFETLPRGALRPPSRIHISPPPIDPAPRHGSCC